MILYETFNLSRIGMGCDLSVSELPISLSVIVGADSCTVRVLYSVLELLSSKAEFSLWHVFGQNNCKIMQVFLWCQISPKWEDCPYLSAIWFDWYNQLLYQENPCQKNRHFMFQDYISCHLENNSTAVRTFGDYAKEIMLPWELKHGAHHILGHVMLD